MKRFRFLKYVVLISLLATSLCWGAAADYKVKSDGTIYGYDLITKGPWIDSRAGYATLEAANTAAYNAGKLLVIAQNHTLTANTILTASVLRIPGGSFTKNGFTLAINGSFQNPDNGQCFIGFAGSDIIFGPGTIDYIKPEWHGASTGIANNATTINKAVGTAHASGKAVFLSGIFPTTATVYLAQVAGDDGVELYGTNKYVSGITYTGTGNVIETNALGSTTLSSGYKLRNMKITGSVSVSSGYGVYVNYSPHGEISDCLIYNTGKHGIYINTNNWTQIIQSNTLSNCGDETTYGYIYVTGNANNNLTIDRNIMFGATRKRWGIYVAVAGSVGVTIINNAIENTVDAISGGHAVTGNYIEGVTDSCIIAGGNAFIGGNFLNPQGYGSTGNYGISIATNGNFIAGNSLTEAAQYGINNTAGYANFISVFEESVSGASTFRTHPWPSNTTVYHTLNTMKMKGNFGRITKTYTVPNDVVEGVLTVQSNLGTLFIINVTDNSNFILECASIQSGDDIVLGIYNHSGGVMGTVSFTGTSFINDETYTNPANGKIKYATFNTDRQITPWTGDVTY